MVFKNENTAAHFLSNISYYRLKGYWWDMQEDKVTHLFRRNSYFDDVIDRYNFDRHFRLILLDAIERVEIALRTKMIYHLSLRCGGLWYLDQRLFNGKVNPRTSTTYHVGILQELEREFSRSREIFVVEHKRKYGLTPPEAWKILEVASIGTLSNLYKNLSPQLPEKAVISNEMGLNLHSELASWLESITYVRNIVAHHSRLWSRTMVKTPIERIKDPQGKWLERKLLKEQCNSPFLIVSCLLFLCNRITPGHHIRESILRLFNDNPQIPIHKLGFENNWETEPLWY